MVTISDPGGPQHLLGNERHHLLGDFHNVTIVRIGLIELELRELRVVLEGDSFVAEISPYLIHTLVAAHNQAFQIQLKRDAQVEVLMELIMICGERPGRCSSIDGLQYRRLDFQEATRIQELTQR